MTIDERINSFYRDGKADFVIKNAIIYSKNFDGHAAGTMPAGIRSICVILDNAEQAEAMKADGWNVKQTRPDDDGNFGYYLPLSIRFDKKPPEIWTKTENGVTTQIFEDTVDELQHAQIAKMDIKVHGAAKYDQKGEFMVKAYVNTMYITLKKDELADEFFGVSENVDNESVPF